MTGRKKVMTVEENVRETMTSLEGLIDGLKSQMAVDPPKPSVSDFVRLVQLRLELGKEYQEHDRRPLEVRWVDDESLPEPDPDPTVPWPGVESLS
jgi:hypothetical protein